MSNLACPRQKKKSNLQDNYFLFFTDEKSKLSVALSDRARGSNSLQQLRANQAVLGMGEKEE